MTRAARFTQADLIRAIEGVKKAGLCVAGAEIKPDGTIRIETGGDEGDKDWRSGSPLYEKAA